MVQPPRIQGGLLILVLLRALNKACPQKKKKVKLKAEDSLVSEFFCELLRS